MEFSWKSTDKEREVAKEAYNKALEDLLALAKQREIKMVTVEGWRIKMKDDHTYINAVGTIELAKLVKQLKKG